MNGFGFRISAAVGSVLVVVGTLAGAATVPASSSAAQTISSAAPPKELVAAEVDQAKAQQRASHAHAEEVKARDDAVRAEGELRAARDAALASVESQQKANQELRAAAAESDPTKAAQLQAAAAQDAAAAASSLSAAAQALSKGQADATKAKHEEKLAEKDLVVAEELAGRAAREQRQAEAQAAKAHKIVICHATHSASNPYVEIEVDLSGLNGHGDHPADLIPAPAGGCPRKNSPVERAEARQAAALDDARAATEERATAAGLEAQAAAEKAKAGQEESLAKSSQASSQTEAASATASEAAATQEHQAAAAESDPTKAAQLESEAVGDDLLAAAERQLSAIDKSLAAVERTEARMDKALSRADHLAAETASAHALDGEEFAQERAVAAHKVLICHATGSTKPAYVEIEVPQIGLHGHGNDANDIVPAPANGCPVTSGASAVARSETNDARTRVPLPGGPLQADLSASKLSITTDESVRLTLVAENIRTIPARNVELCGTVPAGFSIVSAPQARLVSGAPCLTIGRLPPESVAAFALHLRLNSRLPGATRTHLRLLLAAGTATRSAQLVLSVSPGVVPPGEPPVTG